MLTVKVISGPAAGTSIEAEDELTLGREDADLDIPDSEMSRRHVMLRAVPAGVEVEDLGSLNGTHVNGERIADRVTLAHGGTLRLGTSEVQVEVAPTVADPEATKLRPIPAADPEATKLRPIPAADPEATSVRPIPAVAPAAAAEPPTPAAPEPTAERPVPRGSSPSDGAKAPDGSRRRRAVVVAAAVLLALAALLVVLLLT